MSRKSNEREQKTALSDRTGNTISREAVPVFPAGIHVVEQHRTIRHGVGEEAREDGDLLLWYLPNAFA